MNSVPFSIDLYAGFGQCDGLLRDEGTHLALEFQTKDTLAGILKTSVQQVRIPLKDLVAVTLTKGWFGASWSGVKIVLQAARMETLQNVPGMSQGRVELTVARDHRKAAEQLVYGLYQEASSGGGPPSPGR